MAKAKSIEFVAQQLTIRIVFICTYTPHNLQIGAQIENN